MAIHNYLRKGGVIDEGFVFAIADNYDSDTDADLPMEEIFSNHLAMALDASSSSIISIDNQENGIDYRKGVKFLIDTAPDMKMLPSEFVLPLLRNPLSVLHAEIPVIDLSGLDGPVQRRVSTIRDISSACADWGFFRIINHGIEMPLIEEMLKVVEEFFNLTLEEKMKYASDDVMSPVRYGTSLNTSMKHNLHWRDYFRHYAHPFQKSFHLWPDNPPFYRDVAKEYLEKIWQLAMKIASAISEGLEPDKTLGLAAHSDHGGLTILMQNDVDGLQIKHNETWTAVQHVPGTFLVNVGDYLEILSNGRYKSVEHRAVVNAHKKRISVAVGHGPELTAVVAPAKHAVG
ncbi:2-oxoglutarate (2OG) and Fe(II)-dependent oxygenase superfamily protein [Abeliophyllum distichum]|uniref:2-oxoglutarate (2OG) and Fe(II)-dependent oxygenase superfamily protein n=1 Tax=Abeliophyllum distichum TaxID=126358 RepID=A0ABD1QKP1_9LAMI